ncbi:MAG: 4-hydroxy-tetrahydrodipicolinate reductase [Firmicutes bacterium]|nr:4-hydroxy-tetrahydrodipicolinate reductase [Bacillota bacterium]
MMQIGIAGYGKMGKMIRQKALEKGHQVAAVIDPSSDAEEITSREISSAILPLDVIIDFTDPQTLVDNVTLYGELQLPVVIGTTGWYDRLSEVATIVNRAGTGLIWSGNFSLGVNIFFQLVKAAAGLMERFEQYDVLVSEVHHSQKKDSPSGTAEMIGAILLDALSRKMRIITGNPEKPLCAEDLHISSSRVGEVPGIHRVVFDSEIDTISIEHSARDRSGFAEGALLAAEWIVNKKGLYNIDDLMQAVIGGS